MRHRALSPWARLASAGLALALGLASCASGPPVGRDDAVIKRADLDALRAEAARAATLAARVAELEADRARLERERAELAAELTALAQRAGRVPFTSPHLTEATARVRFIDALEVAAPSALPKRGHLGRAAAGRPLVVAFWATWCKPCIADEEIALLGALRAELAQHGAAFASVAIDSIDEVRTHERVDRFLYPLWQRDQATFEMLPEAFVREHGIDMPLFLVVSPSGELRAFRAGQLHAAAVRDLVTAAVLAAKR